MSLEELKNLTTCQYNIGQIQWKMWVPIVKAYILSINRHLTLKIVFII